jgi:O-acetyl-ADP-ribose deacetylase (regulator of RNase III)
MAEERGVRTISFPAISTGVYGYPLGEAAEIAIRETKEHLEKVEAGVEQVIFVLFGKTAFEAYAAALET